MPSASPTLFSVARSKLQSVHGASSKDNCSLHRWVLLKNSIIRSQPSLAAPSGSKADVNLVYTTDAAEEEEVCMDDEHDSFIYPDAGRFVDSSSDTDLTSSQEQWFDSLLETLGDDSEDDEDSDAHLSVIHVDDDEEFSAFTPPSSPMSSTDDLISPVYHDPPIAVPYPIVYPPFHPPLLRPLELDDALHSPLESSFPPLSVALPYYNADDIDDLPVPDAIEDVSDDESDALSIPSYSRSAASFAESGPSPYPHGRMRLHPLPQVYVDKDDRYYSPFELDPLPFPDDHRTSPHMFNNTYHQEC
ncbi:hypothetical protein EVG20_g3371 [Dentipellis fragilis]|uniref:Uncharacterized protein n=1 Tax=Dentipellis fragilis TaxID=205917 RepID=A0A4Y9Z6C0_9AGAM|nr:hypothetical protein EVG20_g3371 [Dentipellis fragilis]